MGEFAHRIERQSNEVQGRMASLRAMRLAATPTPTHVKPTRPVRIVPRFKVVNMARPDGYVRPQAENVLKLIETYGPLTCNEMFQMHESHFGEAIKKAALFFRWGELIELGYIGFTGNFSTDSESGHDNRVYDLAQNISAAQLEANAIERAAKRAARGIVDP